ncbi:MAG TPA: metallophosphoesterase [Pyrinomonadaceae bacterium]|nr:metallophosphoesterase [Pyrinomonadaceae bacterium]
MAGLLRRRLPLKVLAAVLAAGAGLALWGFVFEPDRVTIRRAEVALPSGLPAALDGLRVALVADVHAGAPHVKEEKLARLVEAVNAERPDLILLLGDYVIQGVRGGKFMEPEQVAAGLRGLSAPLGVFAVLGNHDWWFDGVRVARALEGAGVRVLENEAARIEHGGAGLWLVGIADLWTRKPDLAAALSRVSDESPIILFTHNPDLFPQVPPRVALTVAGHTHGGQVNLPLVGRPVVPSKYGQRYADGHIVEGGRHLFVTSGVGTSIIPVRLRVPPEIAVLTLRVGE